MMGIFEEIREQCSEVVERARWVRVDEAEVNLYPERLMVDQPIKLEHTCEHHFLGAGDETLAFFVLLDAINFGSGYFPYLDKEGGVSGYYTVARRLKNYVVKQGIPSSAVLAKTDRQKCAEMLGQDTQSLHMEELMELFALSFRELGAWVQHGFSGDYLGFLRQSKTAEEAVLRLCEMNSFNDRAFYFGSEVPFLKRAQILLQDIKLADPGNELIRFPDINELTAFADNILPYVFAVDRLLILDPWLEGRIASGELIGSGSPEEVELRASSVYIAERLGQLVREHRPDLSVREIDFLIWNRGQKLKKLSDRKRHRTRTMFY